MSDIRENITHLQLVAYTYTTLVKDSSNEVEYYQEDDAYEDEQG